jgi:hypothetical protein
MRLDSVVGAFWNDIEGQENYELPMAEGRYLGFYLPSGNVILKRIEKLIEGEPPAMAYSLSQILEP